MSPPSLRVRRAVDDLLGAYARDGAAAVEQTLSIRSRLRAAIAKLVGARPEEIALTGGASHGLLAIALSLPWRAGDRVVLFEGEFPANVTPWLRAAELFQVRPVFLRARDLEGDAAAGLEALERELRGGARVVAVSAVQFQTGARMPLEEMSRLCHRHGAALCVDAIQAVGSVPFDVNALGVDFAAGGAHKWLMGLEGAGYLYVRQERMPSLRPALAGWLSHDEPVSFLTEGREGLLRYDRPLRRRADVFEASSAASASFAALEAAVDTALELGVERIHDHVQAWCDRLEPALRELGFAVLRAADPAGRSGILSARPRAGVDARRVRDALSTSGVAVAIPDGVVRFSPHWPNSLSEIELVVEALDGAR
ncbi:MAG TPA: aminotransferase class V-fold PLP-dependent enzyme [Anaeromyxobacteraceae bacterium]|nr:aminotransferase class V-fold PLP-dependent enzyme [Anaeromyxobacteraceae bacterium]